jgi:hypothetical protein
MKSARRNLTAFCLLLFLGAIAAAQPRLIAPTAPSSYQPGDRIDPESFVLDRSMEPVRLLDLLNPETRVAVLILFGGAAAAVPQDIPFRGPLWCQDSLDDLGVQRALVRQFAGRPVEFIAVAVPPVYGADRYGFDDDIFLTEPPSSDAYLRNVRVFIEETEKYREGGLLPFEAVYYDPKFRLAQNKAERELDAGYGPVYPWQGLLKWRGDPRRYGTPTIWLIGPQGEILAPPFFGNDYDATPPQVLYGFSELRYAVERLLD